jgi:hypothetical protein
MLDELPSSLVPTHVSPDFVHPCGKSGSFKSWASAYGLFDLMVLAAPAVPGRVVKVTPATNPMMANPSDSRPNHSTHPRRALRPALAVGRDPAVSRGVLTLDPPPYAHNGAE